MFVRVQDGRCVIVDVLIFGVGLQNEFGNEDGNERGNVLIWEEVVVVFVVCLDGVVVQIVYFFYVFLVYVIIDEVVFYF